MSDVFGKTPYAPLPALSLKHGDYEFNFFRASRTRHAEEWWLLALHDPVGIMTIIEETDENDGASVFVSMNIEVDAESFARYMEKVLASLHVYNPSVRVHHKAESLGRIIGPTT